MLEIVIHQPGGTDGVAKLESGAYLVGSGSECHIRIARPEVSSRHAQFIVHDNRLTVIVEPQEDFVVNQNNKITFFRCFYSI